MRVGALWVVVVTAWTREALTYETMVRQGLSSRRPVGVADGAVVKASLFRFTLHAVDAIDLPWARAAMQGRVSDAGYPPVCVAVLIEFDDPVRHSRRKLLGATEFLSPRSYGGLTIRQCVLSIIIRTSQFSPCSLRALHSVRRWASHHRSTTPLMQCSVFAPHH